VTGDKGLRTNGGFVANSAQAVKRTKWKTNSPQFSEFRTKIELELAFSCHQRIGCDGFTSGRLSV
jgi:hypothetical protein